MANKFRSGNFLPFDMINIARGSLNGKQFSITDGISKCFFAISSFAILEKNGCPLQIERKIANKKLLQEFRRYFYTISRYL